MWRFYLWFDANILITPFFGIVTRFGDKSELGYTIEWSFEVWWSRNWKCGEGQHIFRNMKKWTFHKVSMRELPSRRA